MFKFKKNTVNHDFQYVYTIYDTVAKKCDRLFYAHTDEEMIRLHLPSILYKYPLRDIIIRRIGRFDTYTGKLDSFSFKNIPLTKYTFPHSPLSSVGDNITLNDLEETINKVKEEHLEKDDSLNVADSTNKNSEVVNE